MDDEESNIVPFKKPPEQDEKTTVWQCGDCDNQTFELHMDGTVVCAACTVVCRNLQAGPARLT